MDNSIYKRQNEPKILKCLLAQRQIYSEAKNYEFRILLLIFIEIIILIVLFGLGSSFYAAIKAVVGFFILMIYLLLDSRIKDRRKDAAFLQQYIDANLYSGVLKDNINKWINDFDEDRVIDLLSKYGKGNTDFVRNWYEDFSSQLPCCQVFYSQKENVRWDYKLRDAYKKILISFCFFYICFFSIWISQMNCYPSNIFMMALYPIPIFHHICKKIYLLSSDCKRLETIRAQMDLIGRQIKQNNIKDICNELVVLQKKIRENREQGILIPDFFYRFFEKQFHEEEHEIAKNKMNFHKY